MSVPAIDAHGTCIGRLDVYGLVGTYGRVLGPVVLRELGAQRPHPLAVPAEPLAAGGNELLAGAAQRVVADPLPARFADDLLGWPLALRQRGLQEVRRVLDRAP